MPTDPRIIYMDRIPPYGPDAFMPNGQREHVPRIRPYRDATQARELYVLRQLAVSLVHPGRVIDDLSNREFLVKAGIFQGVEPCALAALTGNFGPSTSRAGTPYSPRASRVTGCTSSSRAR